MENKNGVKYAGFWIRLFAFLIDTFIVWIPIKILESIIDTEEWFGLIVLILFLWFFYGYLLYLWRGTIGKRILGLEVLNYDLTPISLQKASFRFLYSLLTYTIIFATLKLLVVFSLLYGPLIYIFYLILGLPILMIFVTDKKQVLHDYLAKTIVVDIAYMSKSDNTKNSIKESSPHKRDLDENILEEKSELFNIKKVVGIIGAIIVLGYIIYNVYILYIMSSAISTSSSLAKYKSQAIHKKLEKFQSINDHNDSRIQFYIKELNISGQEYMNADTVSKLFKARVKRKLALNCIGYFLQEHNDSTWLDQVQSINWYQLNTFEQNYTVRERRESMENWNFYKKYYFNELYEAQAKVANSFEKEVSQYSCDELQTVDKMFDRFLPIYISMKEKTLSHYIEEEERASYFGTLNKSFYRRSIKETQKLLDILYQGFPLLHHKTEKQKSIEQNILKKTENKKDKMGIEDRNNYEKDIKRGVPPLFAAIQNHQYEKLEALLRSGEDVEQKNKFGTRPLSFAVNHQDIKSVKLLLEYGANPNVMDGYGEYTPLSAASMRNQIETVKLLLDYGADVNYQYNKSETALTVAAKGCKNLGMVKLLLDYGADPKIKDEFGYDTISGLSRYCRDKDAYREMKAVIESSVQ